MKRPDVEKNMQLILCWNEIRQWIIDNGKALKVGIPMKAGQLNIAKGEATLWYNDNTSYIHRNCWYQGFTRKALTTVARTQEKPFLILEDLVTGWNKYKELIMNENEKINRIYNFKT